MELNSITQVAVFGVYLLIFFLGYPSQILFSHLDPAPLTKSELYVSNVVLVLIFVTYSKSVFVDPGRIPESYGKQEEKEQGERRGDGVKRTKWCRKCDAAKPPRAHHCKECKRCIPKMDHHCPWTANCVSHTTFPHFLRFLTYTTGGLSWLEYLLWIRIAHLWENRNLPSYLGPNPFLVAHLFFTTVINTITLFGVGVLMIRNVWCLAVNTTTIEGWEVERHKTLLRRARHFGGTLSAPDGTKVCITKQEFPYDVGIWANVVQGMGTANPLSWLNPLAATPPVADGLAFPTNGFEDPGVSWPPPDPDRSYRRPAPPRNGTGTPFTYAESTLDAQQSLAAFRERQSADAVRRRKPFVQRIEARLAKERRGLGDGGYSSGDDDDDTSGDDELARESKTADDDDEGEEAWRNSEGERLKDFGVDEEVEFYDEQEDDDEDVPLSELLARKRAASGNMQT